MILFATKEGGSMFSDRYIGPVINKPADQKTIMKHHTRGQTRKKLSSTIMKNLNKLKLNDS